MSRVQLALNVSDIDAAVEFYSKLFGPSRPSVGPGYANFAIAEPPLKLVLIENPGRASRRGRGPEPSRRRSRDPRRGPRPPARLAGEGLDPDVQEATTCCYARAGQGLGQRPRRRPVGGLHRAGRRAAETGLGGDGTCCARDASRSDLAPAARPRPRCC